MQAHSSLRTYVHSTHTYACTYVQAGDSPLQMGPKIETSGSASTNPVSSFLRLILGTLAGFYYFVLPIYMYLKNLVWPKDWEM